ncbi:haloacid dehalogenase [Halarcobacter ebronensis]|uniref:phosphoglycolate phosphatase n=1 Tax=Halarcobacter ebronensis TaxID=1462615 RepID=A0A4Q0YA02_9BACT|nr:HAD-IA family hydrolase [Halarcobacter ebronensis]RXJ66843.1 haloacid dehalogenase [Halarcobacter ebronensis]
MTNKRIKNIIFDFDGVILDSVPIKTEAYRRLFKNYDNELIEKLVNYHELNGGISRYKKIEYFFKKILKQKVTEQEVFTYANKYSEITKEELIKEKYIIQDAFNFIKENYKKYNIHIASGADENDLKYICDKLNLTRYFLTINGSPKEKKEIIKNILENNSYKKDETILIGDSINDYEASVSNQIEFYGFNNIKLQKFKYVKSFKTLNNLIL